MLERDNEKAARGVDTEQMRPLYEILSIYDGRVFWKELFRRTSNTTRGLPNRDLRTEPTGPSLTVIHYAHLLS